jgi:hypothetical protein
LSTTPLHPEDVGQRFVVRSLLSPQTGVKPEAIRPWTPSTSAAGEFPGYGGDMPTVLVFGTDAALRHDARTQLEAAGMDVLETDSEDEVLELPDEVDGIVLAVGEVVRQ